MKFGSSPPHRYSSHIEDVPQSFLSLKISSVKVDPEAPIKTLDIAHIVLSSIASTYNKSKQGFKRFQRLYCEKGPVRFLPESHPLYHVDITTRPISQLNYAADV